MKRLDSIVEKVSNVFGYLSGWLVPLMVLLIFFEVFMRYIVRRPPLIADEMSAYMLVAVSFLGIAYTWREKGHVRITALVSRLPAKMASWLRLMTLVLAFIFVVGLIQANYGYLVTSFKFGMVSNSWLRTPLQGPQLTVVVGFVILSLLLMADIARAIKNIRTGKNIEETTR